MTGLQARSVRIATLVSVGVHAAVLLPVLLARAPDFLAEEVPLLVDTCVLTDEPGQPTLAESPAERIWNMTLTPAEPASIQPVVVPAIDLGPPVEVAPSQPVIRPASYAAAGASRGSGASTGNSTGPAPTTSFFRVPTLGHRVVYVVDRSVSMGLNNALVVVKAELIASLHRLPGDASFQVIFYNGQARPLVLNGTAGMMSATEENKAVVLAALAALNAEGRTDHLPALKLALTFQPDAIYFLTDADDLSNELVQTITEMNRGRTVIHTVEMTLSNRQRDDLPLHRLARDNRGIYQAVAVDKAETRN